MPFATLTTHFVEKSSGSIIIRFRDRDDQPVIPNLAAWTLSDENGNAINDREDVSIGSPATQVEILLKGDDLALSSNFSGISEMRVFLVEGTYDSDLGSDIPLKEQCFFYVDNLNAVT